MQHAAFQDLCFMAEAQGPQAWRRKMVFDKDDGELWQQIGIICVDEVRCSCPLMWTPHTAPLSLLAKHCHHVHKRILCFAHHMTCL